MRAVRIAPGEAFLGQRNQRFLGIGKADAVFIRVFGVFQFAEREIAAIEKAQRAVDRLRRAAQQPRHLGGRFEMSLGIGLEQAAGGVDRDVLADAGHDVLQLPPLGRMIEHVVHRDERDAGVFRDGREFSQPAIVVAAIEHTGGEPDMARSRGGEAGESSF